MLIVDDPADGGESILPSDWQPERFATLIYLIRDDEVLLIEKLRGHGAGKVNAPGGHIEVGESPEDCAIREAFEEVGITVLHADLRATLRFHDTENGFNMLGYAFVSTMFSWSADAHCRSRTVLVEGRSDPVRTNVGRRPALGTEDLSWRVPRLRVYIRERRTPNPQD